MQHWGPDLYGMEDTVLGATHGARKRRVWGLLLVGLLVVSSLLAIGSLLSRVSRSEHEILQVGASPSVDWPATITCVEAGIARCGDRELSLAATVNVPATTSLNWLTWNTGTAYVSAVCRPPLVSGLRCTEMRRRLNTVDGEVAIYETS